MGQSWWVQSKHWMPLSKMFASGSAKWETGFNLLVLKLIYTMLAWSRALGVWHWFTQKQNSTKESIGTHWNGWRERPDQNQQVSHWTLRVQDLQSNWKSHSSARHAAGMKALMTVTKQACLCVCSLFGECKQAFKNLNHKSRQIWTFVLTTIFAPFL